jgi:hypothetical protein
VNISYHFVRTKSKKGAVQQRRLFACFPLAHSKNHIRKKNYPVEEMPPKAKKQSAPPSPDLSGLVEFAAFHNHAELIEGRTNPRSTFL